MSCSMKSSMRYSSKMKILSFFLVAVLMFSVSAIPEVSARANQVASEKGLLTKPKTSPFITCIDDSDCMKISEHSNNYACFQYICYPWKDDSKVAAKDKIAMCRKDSDCKENAGQKCYRHMDRRTINKGLCFDELQACGIEVTQKCPRGKGCCGSFCCENKYFNQYKDLPCSNHIGCQDLDLGQFCCPRKGQNSVCCSTDPDPPKPKPAPTSDKGAATSTTATAFTSSLLSTAFFFLLM